MDISKKALIITLVINLLILCAGVACMFLLNFSVLSIGLFAGIAVLVLVSSILVWHYGKNFKK
ncbi:MAG: hypothetical protein IJ538_04285 [Clostridia bacterium]|nr:hypothetical protein [Clostridia bacterium]